LSKDYGEIVGDLLNAKEDDTNIVNGKIKRKSI